MGLLWSAVLVTCGFATAMLVPWVLAYLQRKAILCLPNHRSSHETPTPRGGGLAVVPVVVVAWLIILLTHDLPAFLAAAAIGAAILMAVSWIDDQRGLPVRLRLAVHVLAVAAIVYLLPGEGKVLQGAVPLVLDRVLTGVALLWFLNLYNFMDGIDGITGVQTAAIGLGVALVAWMLPESSALGLLGLALGGSSLAFLAWNWHPARLFLGDVGSVPLGFLVGCLLIGLAMEGHLVAAVILPAYYCVDATLTLLMRVARRERFWEAHRQHFYQLAVRRGESHDRVSLRIGVANALLIVMASVAVAGWWLEALFLSAVIVAGLLVSLARGRRTVWS